MKLKTIKVEMQEDVFRELKKDYLIYYARNTGYFATRRRRKRTFFEKYLLGLND